MSRLTKMFRDKLKNKKKILKEELKMEELYCLQISIHVTSYRLNGRKRIAKFDAIDLQDII